MKKLPLPWPTEACPRPGDCFYCRWYLRCPLHAGEPLDLLGHAFFEAGRR